MTLSREARLNALNTATRARLCEVMEAASSDDGVAVIVLTGAGERAFCAGQDLNESAALSAEAGEAWMATWSRFFESVSSCTKPIVAAVNGVAAGAGLQLALMADLRIAVPEARLLMAEVNVGLPAIVGAYLLNLHLGQSRMRELVLTGRAMSAEEALTAGVVHRIVPRAGLADAAMGVAQDLADKPPTARRLTLGNLRLALRAGLAEAEAAAESYQTRAIATGEPQAAMAGFLNRRDREATQRS